MLLKVDASALEWRVKVYLAQDAVAIKEINEGFPIHDDNQRVFGLPTRTIAKAFLYRAIYADAFGPRGKKGPAFAYANDSDFMAASTSVKFWEGVIERFFEKYQGVYSHSAGLIKQAIEEGVIVSPSGRFYRYERDKFGNWPHTTILNYVVQGLSADFVMIARLLLKQRLQEIEAYHQGLILPINTVHDSIELDVANDPELCYNICILLQDCFKDIPKTFEKNYGVVVNTPMAGEVKYGWTLYEPAMVKFNSETFYGDFQKICNFL